MQFLRQEKNMIMKTTSQ